MNGLQFCAFETPQFKSIRNLLCDTFNTSDEELLSFYQTLRENFNKTEWPSPIYANRSFFKSADGSFQSLYDERAEIVGCDLPSLLSKGGQKATVMIIAQDPYSTEPSDFIGIGTPYAMHIKQCREKIRTTKLYFRLIDVLLEQGYQTYLTDVYKIYVRGIKLSKTDRKKFDDVLRREIEIVKPAAIVTWGKKATNAVAKLKLHSPHHEYPHPSGAANGAFAKLMQKRATDQNKCDYWKEDILHKLSNVALES